MGKSWEVQREVLRGSWSRKLPLSQLWHNLSTLEGSSLPSGSLRCPSSSLNLSGQWCWSVALTFSIVDPSHYFSILTTLFPSSITRLAHFLNLTSQLPLYHTNWILCRQAFIPSTGLFLVVSLTRLIFLNYFFTMPHVC